MRNSHTFLLVFCVVLLTAGSVRAEECRVFGFFSPLAADNAGCPDWDASDSVSIVAHPASDPPTRTVHFAFQEDYPLVSETIWADGDATHVTMEGPDKIRGSYVWLGRAVPPNGAVAKTGCDGDVLFLASYFVRELFINGRYVWVVEGVNDGETDPPLGTTDVFCVGMGMFSK